MLQYIATCLIIGIIATLGMTTFLWIVTRLKLCNVDMVKAIGSWYTRKEETAFLPGLLVHLTAGVLFCFAYLFLFSVLPNSEKVTFIYAIFGAGIGFVHGMVVALCLVVLVAEHHPVPKFKKAGVRVAAYHFLAHIIYGLIIGSLYIFLLGGKAANF